MSKPKTPLLAVDGFVFDWEGKLLLVRRKNSPFRGALALPGGYVEVGETVEDACRKLGPDLCARPAVRQTSCLIRKVGDSCGRGKSAKSWGSSVEYFQFYRSRRGQAQFAV